MGLKFASAHDGDDVECDLRFSRICAIRMVTCAAGAMRCSMKTLMCSVAFAAVFATAGAAADRSAELQAPPVVEYFSGSQVPAPHQNHCGNVNGHYVCADRCGNDYQVYYCPASATGCCHVGLGYCDAAGRLRCSPPWFDFSLIP
jgi:hypothetical protein